jgi:hypothetical protein
VDASRKQSTTIQNHAIGLSEEVALGRFATGDTNVAMSDDVDGEAAVRSSDTALLVEEAAMGDVEVDWFSDGSGEACETVRRGSDDSSTTASADAKTAS